MFGFMRRRKSREIAKDRLKLLLISDRADCSTEVIEFIKNDLIRVISKYIEIDEEQMDVQITWTKSENYKGNVPALYANIPIIDMRKHDVRIC